MSARSPVDALLALPRFGAGIGLHRAAHVVGSLDPQWWAQTSAIGITGSNGKGSVATMVAEILSALGLRVGLFTSPHLLRFHERIRVQGEPIGDEDLRASADWFAALDARYQREHPGDERGAFEAFTAVALHHFARRQVDVVVAEAGIGGRFDPTRALGATTCALASVDLEHTELLGRTEAAIAFDKADLCAPGGDLIVGPLAPSLLGRLRAYACVRGIHLRESADCQPLELGIEGTRAQLTVAGLPTEAVWVPAAGLHQLDNASVAAATAAHWVRRHRPRVDSAELSAAIKVGLGRVRLVGRLECVATDPTVIVDVGHTPAATARVALTLGSMPNGAPYVLVAGVSGDRDPEKILAPLLPQAMHVIATMAHHRPGAPARISEAVRRAAPALSCIEEPSIERAMQLALEMAKERQAVVVVAGGMFTAMEARCVVLGEDPSMLRAL